MRLTKFEHSCVRLESGTTTVVVDPGGLTDPGAARGADAVLITHEHFDHFEQKTLCAAVRERPDLLVRAPEPVAASGTRRPTVRNVGYRLADRIFHPGDAFTVPEAAVDVLLVPANAPWSKALEVLDYADADRLR